MNPKERLLTSLWLEEPDRIPLDLYIGFNPLSPESWPKNSTLLDPTDPRLRSLGELVRKKCDPLISGGLGIKRNFFYTSCPVRISTEQCVEGNVEVVRTVVETPKGPLTQVYRRPQAVTWSGRRSKAFVESDEELERFLSIPYKMVEPDTDPFIRLTRKVGDRGLVHSSISEPIRLVWSLMGQRKLSLMYFRSKDSILALEDLLFKRVCDYLDNVLRKGVRFFLVGGPGFVTPPLFGARHF